VGLGAVALPFRRGCASPLCPCRKCNLALGARTSLCLCFIRIAWNISRCIQKRLHYFGATLLQSAGTISLSGALRLGLHLSGGVEDPPPVLQGLGREPAWPQGIVGSITHCGPWAIAAVASSESIEALGIDLEDYRVVPHEEMADLICRDSEK
jgi:4'-phosphopantetheinyl transferase N-terminal domain